MKVMQEERNLVNVEREEIMSMGTYFLKMMSSAMQAVVKDESLTAELQAPMANVVQDAPAQRLEVSGDV